jgi:DNA segregation ATPase FtsK/SpoIIIE, S-DNA-T family
MPLESHDTDTWSRPLLPASLEARVLGALAQLAGLLLLVGAAAGWVALITWTAAAPTDVPPAARSLLGLPGTVFADGVLQHLGATALLLLAAPMMWGIELATRRQLVSWRSKLLLFPLAVLALAGGLAAVRTPAAWPLVEGLGGALGGIVLALAATLLQAIVPRDALWVAGALLSAAGAAGIAHTIGLSLEGLMPTRDLSFRRRMVRPRAATRIAGGDVPPAIGGGPTLNFPRDAAGDRPAADPRPVVDDRHFDRHGVDRPTSDHPDFVGHAHARSLSDGRLDGRGDADRSLADDGFDTSRYGDFPPLEIYTGDRDDTLEARAASAAIAERFAVNRSALGGGYGAGDPLADGADRAVSRGVSFAGAVTGFAGAFVRGATAAAYRRPSLSILRRPPPSRLNTDLTQTVLRGTARLLEDVLADFGVRGAVRAMRSGPVVTVFEFEAADGVKPTRIAGLADDVARAMGTTAIRIAPVPGRGIMVIEVPNPRRDMIVVRDILAADAFRQPGLKLPLALGKTLTGSAVVIDLARVPAVLVAGADARAAVAAINTMLLSLVFRHGPEDCRLLLIDPRMTDLAAFAGLPHLAMPVVATAAKGVAAIDWVIGQIDERTRQFAVVGVRSLDVYNNRVRNARRRGERASRTVQTGYHPETGAQLFERESFDAEPLPYLVVVVGELADVMLAGGAALEQGLVRLARFGQAVGIHVVMATDRPTADVITPELRAVATLRICFRVLSKIDSRTVLGDGGAEQLLADGDMLVVDAASGLVRMHAAIPTADEIEAVVAAVHADDGRIDADPLEGAEDPRPVGMSLPRGSSEDLYSRAAALIVRERVVSPQVLQRRLGIDLDHASALIERMRRDGLV